MVQVAAARPLGKSARVPHVLLRMVAALLVLIIFLVDTLSTMDGAVAVLYVVAVLLVAQTGRRSDIHCVAAAALTLTLVSYLASHGIDHVGAQTVRAVVSLAAVVITALLALRSQRSFDALSEQAMLLDLSHDMIFTRDRDGRILFWNRSAVETYGWPVREAVGQFADALLATRYLQPREDIEARLLSSGRWEGVLEQTTHDGRVLRLESRWVLQRDKAGRPRQVLETHTDVTERQAAHAALVRSERRYRRMFDATRIGVVQQDWGAVLQALAARGLGEASVLADALERHPELLAELREQIRVESVNPAFETMAELAPGEPVPGVSALLAPSDASFGPSLLAFVSGAAFFEGETELLRRDGRRVPVLFTITFPADSDHQGSVLVFVVDITERKQAQNAMLAAQAELAHATRVATLGEMTASIAHEVNQPLMAVVTNGEAGMRWLRRPQPDLGEVAAAIGRIIDEGRRAGEIVKRVRDFLSKTPAARQALDVAVLMANAVALVRHEFVRAGVEVSISVDEAVPCICGDRIQLEQILVNLMLNASQAMCGQATPRRIRLEALAAEPAVVHIRVADTGPGIAPQDLQQLFQPFYTTRAGGMGMGLAICRTTAEAHGGCLTVDSELGRGSVFQLTLHADWKLESP